MAMTGSKCTSATTGKGERSHTWPNASKHARLGIAMRTISQPASASASICAKLPSTSSGGMFNMDCTATGAPPPIGTEPTMTRRVCSFGFIEPFSLKWDANLRFASHVVYDQFPKMNRWMSWFIMTMKNTMNRAMPAHDM